MSHRIAALLLCCLLPASFCAGCGYTLATDSPSVLGDGLKTLKVKGVDYPTLHPWLPNTLRSLLRDEIGARRLARWVDSGPADFTIQINVLSFTNREWISSELDTTELFASSITLEAVVYSGAENREVWRSDKISYSEYEAQVDEKALSGSILKQIIRRLCDEMRNTF
ncbi:MAG: LPS assembly lipoprotein LptE [Desulfovibrio sp.]|nr:LPS assembly lipoprotein LptE [Desulfovibrio sp.]